MADKPCLHCELLDTIVKFMEAHPDYDKCEMVTDTMQVTGEIIQKLLDHGVKLDIPGVHIIKSESWQEPTETKH